MSSVGVFYVAEFLAANNELPFDPPLTSLAALGVLDDGIPQLNRRATDGRVSAVNGVAVTTINPATGRSHLMYVSENLADMLGFRPDQLLGRSPHELFADRTPMAQLDAAAAVVERGEQAILSLDLRHANGRDVSVEATFLALPAPNGGWPCFLALYRDNSSWPKPEQLLADQSAMLDSLARGHDVVDVLRQVSGRIQDQVPGASCWVGLVDGVGLIEPVLVGRHSEDLVDDVLQELTQSGQTSTPSCSRVDDLPLELGLALRAEDIASLWVYPIVGADRRSQGVLIISVADRTEPHPSEHQMFEHLSRVAAVAVERSRAEASLAHQTLHDSLTQLPNRALIVDRLEQAVARLGRDNNRLAVLLVDLDRFKALNDTRGPDVGDEVLIEVSRRLRRSVRLGDTVGRIGGDQFLVLCVAMNGELDASSMAERIVESVSEPLVLTNEKLSVSASVGVVLVNQPGQSPASIISSAESALASAVDAGRGGFALYEEGLQQRVLIRHDVEQALQVALTEDELVLHFQPLVEMSSGRMIGAEALIRWNRPGHGLMPPNSFIEIAEETGLIVPVGAWVIDETCRQLANWPVGPDGNGPVITVNLSARQLAESSLVSTVLAAMERHDVPPERLGFEVTESMRVEEVETAIVTLKRLAALGCKLAIDDFGVGYASLDYLRRFSMADTLKIDRSFVSGLGESREDTAIVSSSIALAKSLEMSVVAEGVETSDQYHDLAAMGCDYAQGYLLSRPVPLDQVLELWERSTLIKL